MAKVTLYVPDALHARLDELGPEVNLSRIFRRGLAAELAALGPSTTPVVIETTGRESKRRRAAISSG